jgi:hypothetical protein
MYNPIRMQNNINTTTENKENTKTYIVVLPIEGRPYIDSIFPEDKEKKLIVLEMIVGGYLEKIPHGYYTIHPLFARENMKWDIVRQLLTSKLVSEYGNANGMNECSANVGVVIMPNYRFPGYAPHAWGNEVLLVPERVLKALKVSLDNLKEDCAGCMKELGDTYKEQDTLTRLCLACVHAKDEE